MLDHQRLLFVVGKSAEGEAIPVMELCRVIYVLDSREDRVAGSWGSRGKICILSIYIECIHIFL